MSAATTKADAKEEGWHTDREDAYEATRAAYDARKCAYIEECDALRAAADARRRAAKKTKKNPPAKTRTFAEKANAAKRPVSAYLYFCAAKRRGVVVSKRAKSLGVVSKELARLWAEAGVRGERGPFEEMAAEDRERYRREVAAAVERSCGGDGGGFGGGSKEVPTTARKAPAAEAVRRKKPAPRARAKTSNGENEKGHVASKRAPSAYVLFCGSRRKDVVSGDGKGGPRPSFGETSRILSQMWRNCDEETRAHFVELAERAKQQL